MLGENIRNLRKQKGYSQETLAAQLNVVRQTVSKWEKGLSVPDAEMLERLAEIFEVSAAELLGSSIPSADTAAGTNEIAAQLAILNGHLAKQAAFRRQVLRIILGVLAAMILITVLAAVLFSADTSSPAISTEAAVIEYAE